MKTTVQIQKHTNTRTFFKNMTFEFGFKLLAYMQNTIFENFLMEIDQLLRKALKWENFKANN